MEVEKVKSLVDAAAVKKDLAVNKAIDFVKEKANVVTGEAEKKPAKKTTRKTTKKAERRKKKPRMRRIRASNLAFITL